MDRRARRGLHHGSRSRARGRSPTRGRRRCRRRSRARPSTPRSGPARCASGCPGRPAFVELTAPQQLPIGTTFDTTAGRVTLTSAGDTKGATQHAWFYEGTFTHRPDDGVAADHDARARRRAARAARRAAAARRRRPSASQRHLWGDGKGRFRTGGRFSSATVRGTRWVVSDRCDGTLTRVVRGIGHGPRPRAPQDRDRPRGRAVPRARAGERDAVSWVSVFAGFLVAHMVGDYLLQTDWQARHKRGGLSDPAARRPLADPRRDLHARLRARLRVDRERARRRLGAWSAALLVFIPHLVVDDGRVVRLYLARVKHVEGFDVGRRLVGRPVLPRALAVARGAAAGGRVNRRSRRLLRTLLLVVAMVVIVGAGARARGAPHALRASSQQRQRALQHPRDSSRRPRTSSSSRSTTRRSTTSTRAGRSGAAATREVIRNLTKAGRQGDRLRRPVHRAQDDGRGRRQRSDRGGARAAATRAWRRPRSSENGTTRIFGGARRRPALQPRRSRRTRTTANDADGRIRHIAVPASTAPGRRSRSRPRRAASRAQARRCRAATAPGSTSRRHARAVRRLSFVDVYERQVQGLATCAARSSWSATTRRRCRTCTRPRRPAAA